MSSRTTDKQVESAKSIFRRYGGILKTGDALDHGIHRRTLYAMREEGIIERMERGLYRLADLPPLSDPDLVTVALKVPQCVVCLISALHFHNITTQIPHVVSIAIKRGAERPRLEFPPIQPYWFSGEAFTAGVEQHSIEHTTVQVYSVEKTLADCFKFRNKIGMDTVREALTLYRERKKPNPRKLIQFAKICRVEKVMRPYLEALL
jgi:predicted transcriptional regulator of viral defense system